MRSPDLRRYTNAIARRWLVKARAATNETWRHTCAQCALGARRGYRSSEWSAWRLADLSTTPALSAAKPARYQFRFEAQP